MSACTAGYTWRACAGGGSTCDAPRDAPSSVQAQPQPSSLGCVSRPQVCRRAGSEAGPRAPPGWRTRLRGAQVPPPKGQPRAIGPSGRPNGGPANETSRGAGGARARPGAGGGGQGALPEVTSGGSRGALPRQPRFHLSAFPGGRPLPFSFFLNGVLWGGRRRKEAKGRPRPSATWAALAV